MFAKIFEFDSDKLESNQILVMRDTDDDERPLIKVFFEPKGYFLCSFTISGFEISEDGDIKCQKMFDHITEDQACRTVTNVFEKLEL